jgi:hypothetical protein
MTITNASAFSGERLLKGKFSIFELLPVSTVLDSWSSLNEDLQTFPSRGESYQT